MIQFAALLCLAFVLPLQSQEAVQLNLQPPKSSRPLTADDIAMVVRYVKINGPISGYPCAQWQCEPMIVEQITGKTGEEYSWSVTYKGAEYWVFIPDFDFKAQEKSRDIRILIPEGLQ